MRRTEIGRYLVIDPEICHGQMIFKGTRVPVDTVLTFLDQGYSIDQLLQSWPELDRLAIEEATRLVAHSLWVRHPVLTGVVVKAVA